MVSLVLEGTAEFHVGGEDVTGQPLLAVFGEAYSKAGKYVLGSVASQLSPEEAEAWWAAVDEAEAEGTFFFTWPHHCAVGTKAANDQTK